MIIHDFIYLITISAIQLKYFYNDDAYIILESSDLILTPCGSR